MNNANRSYSINSFHESPSRLHSRGMIAIDVRPALPDDAPALARIYNQGIEDRIATLEIEPRTPDERRTWLSGRGPPQPLAGRAVAGSVFGWSSLNSFNPRAAYDHVADISVYIERGWRGRGVGRRLLTSLIALGGELGYHKLVLAAFPFNNAGI